MTAPRSEVAGRLEVVRAGDHHAEIVAEFFRAVWSPAATADGVLRSWQRGAAGNLAEPGVPPPTWIAVRGGTVVGYVTTIPIRVWNGSAERPAYWIKGLMVLPEFRNGPIGFAVLKAAATALPLTGALAVATPARRLFAALGYVDKGPVRNWIRPLRPGRLLAGLELSGDALTGVPGPLAAGARMLQGNRTGLALADAGGTVLSAAASAVRLAATSRRAEVVRPGDVTPGLDRLWDACRRGLSLAVVRDSRYLTERYGTQAGPYRWVALSERGSLAGLAVVREPRPDADPRFRNVRLATLADMVYPPDRAELGVALLGGVEEAARGMDAQAVVASASAPALVTCLRRQCYLPMGGNVHLLVRDAAGEVGRLTGPLTDWWLTRGDGAADEVF